MSDEETRGRECTMDDLCDEWLAAIRDAEEAEERDTMAERVRDLSGFWKRMRAIQGAMRRVTEGKG